MNPLPTRRYQISMRLRVVLTSIAALAVASMAGGCQSINSQLMNAGVHQRFNTSSPCDGISSCEVGPCAGYNETNWTVMQSCSSWDSSIGDVPIPYQSYEAESFEYEPVPDLSAASEQSANSLAAHGFSVHEFAVEPPRNVSRSVTSSHVAEIGVQQASFLEPEEIDDRETGINDEVFEYAQSLNGQSLNGQSLTDHATANHAGDPPVNHMPLDKVSIEYLQ